MADQLLIASRPAAASAGTALPAEVPRQLHHFGILTQINRHEAAPSSCVVMDPALILAAGRSYAR